MFQKKKCPKCKENIEKKDRFCANCGIQLRKTNKEEYGLLGEDDFLEQTNSPFDSFFNGLGGGMIDKMMANAMKMFEKEIQRINTNPAPNTKFRLMINGKEVPIGNMPIQKEQKHKKRTESIPLPSKILKEFATLPREEPKTNIRRIGNSILYEIELPGVESLEDISIQNLGTSIEVRAVAKNTAYLKTISINLPVIGYEFNKNNLTLELEAQA